LHWACDIEADGLLETATTIWCATAINCITKEKKEFRDAEAFRTFIEKHPDIVLVGHNFLAYDLVMLNRFWKCSIGVSRVVDTFVLSQLYNPGYPKPIGCKKGPHSLEAWGIRLRYKKGDFDDFSEFTEDMLRYCMRDTVLTALLFHRLSTRMREVGFTEEGCELEHKAWNIIQNKQRRNGFPFDYERAHALYVALRAREEELKAEIYTLWPPKFEVVATFAKAFKKNGEKTAVYARHLEQYPKLILREDGGYDAIDWVAFNLGSPAQRIEKLTELGWTSVKKTKKGNPKIDEDALLDYAEVSGKPEVKALAKWIVINSRANMIKTWLDAYDEKTGAIHGKLFIAATLRYRHSNPNSANIPAVRLKKNEQGEDVIQYGEAGAWTYECRDLFTKGKSDDYVLVGVDGTGIQNRCLIHGLIKTVGEEQVKPFMELSLRGDIHKHNIDVLGLANKAAAKKFYYSLMMGAGGALLAADQAQFGTKLTAKEGTALRDAMIASIPGFNALIKALQKELRDTGRIRLCDGTPILVPSDHMVIPYLLQGDESRLMKKAMVLLDADLRRSRLDSRKVADIHDEWQYIVKLGDVEAFIRLALAVFPRAGESFGYKIPIDGDAKVGLTWAETH
jgi:DNA polymerase I-like protein with 3'-5' exonuclease and polymerase domains